MKSPIHSRQSSAFTLVEIMIVVMVIALLASIAVPNYMRARKRTQALRVLDEAKMLSQAIDQYAIEHNRIGTTPIGPADVPALLPYVKNGSPLYFSLPNDFMGNPFSMTTIDAPPKVSALTFNVLSDVAPQDFWSPYNP